MLYCIILDGSIKGLLLVKITDEAIQSKKVCMLVVTHLF